MVGTNYKIDRRRRIKMKEKFVNLRFSDNSLSIIDIANEILTEYKNQGYDLSLRQLYYQFND